MERLDGQRRQWAKQLRSDCKDCGVVLTSGNATVIKKNGRLYFHTYCKPCNAKRTASWKINNVEWMRKYMSSYNLKKYGVTKEWFDGKFSEQEGKCGICGTSDFGSKLAHVDHCHATGVARGLLCGKCNTALERIESIPNWAEKASEYLVKCTTSQKLLLPDLSP